MKTTAHQRIRAAMRANERAVLAHINRQGVYYPAIVGRSSSWRNALDRLVAKGKVRYRNGCGRFRIGGYIALSKHA